VILEYTGSYYQPIACVLHQAGLHVSVVHAKLIHDYGNNTIRKFLRIYYARVNELIDQMDI
jgi:transposase